MVSVHSGFESLGLAGWLGSSEELILLLQSRCGPCRLTVPVVKEVMKAYKDRIDVVEIDTDELPDVAENAQVNGMNHDTFVFLLSISHLGTGQSPTTLML